MSDGKQLINKMVSEINRSKPAVRQLLDLFPKYEQNIHKLVSPQNVVPKGTVDMYSIRTSKSGTLVCHGFFPVKKFDKQLLSSYQQFSQIGMRCFFLTESYFGKTNGESVLMPVPLPGFTPMFI